MERGEETLQGQGGRCRRELSQEGPSLEVEGVSLAASVWGSFLRPRKRAHPYIRGNNKFHMENGGSGAMKS